MKTRTLGHSSIEVKPFMFGGNVFGWTIDEATSFKILDAFVDAGFNFIDTADCYSNWIPGNKGGESETILGNWMKARKNRDRIILATKVGIEMGPGKKGLSQKYITQAVEDSLSRLQTDYIDLYQSHQDDPNTELEETLSAYSDLIRAGKVRVIGASNFSGDRLSAALEVSKRMNIPAYQSLQPLYNLYDREAYEKDTAPVCKKYGLGVIPYFSLASGFLAGKYRSEKDLVNSKRANYIQKYLNPRGMKILDALNEISSAKSATPSQVAIAWLITRPQITAAIVSATSLAQLNDLTGAFTLDLSPEAIRTLDSASSF
jgi:aryl-alcohol dehydrogenase-like predicted oxidoreductase